MRSKNVEALTVEILKEDKAALKEYARKLKCSVADLLRPKVKEVIREIK